MAATTTGRHVAGAPGYGTPTRATGARAGSAGLRLIGLVAIVVSAWAAIVPYVGPTFGYSADGTGSWHWTLAHSVLALIPGVIGVLMGFAILSASSEIGRGRSHPFWPFMLVSGTQTILTYHRGPV